MKPFIFPIEDFVRSERTEITAAVTAGAAVNSAVKSTNGIVADDYCIVGREGQDGTEIAKVLSITAYKTITFATLKYDHVKGTPITKIRFNQMKLYGCATEDGTYVIIGSAKDIEVDNPKGTHFEYTGSTYLYFKATYYNEVTAEETDKDDSVAVRAGDIEHYCSLSDIREESGFTDNQYIGDGMIEIRRLSAEAEVKASVGAVYTLPLSADCELVKVITRLLAAGWLMWKEYGEEASGTDKDGIAKVTQARSMLKAIRNGNLKLLDSSDVELSAPATDLGGWPNSTTKDAAEADGGGKTHFRIKKQF